MSETSPKPTDLDTRQPFSRADARGAGLSTAALSTRRFTKIGWDTYVERTVPVTLRLRAQAVLQAAAAGSRISHHTAAELWGAVVPADRHVHVSVPTVNDRLVRAGVKSHYAGAAATATTFKGVRISSPTQTFVELAASGLRLVDLVVLADSLIAGGHTTTAELTAAAAAQSGRGTRVARRAAGLARAGVDSAMETRLRLLIVLAGLPEPRVNVVLRGVDGEWRRRYDLVYEEFRLIVEYDGRQHARDDRQWLTDIHRREELDRMHWRLVVVTADGIYRQPGQTLDRVRDALRDCGATGIRRHYADEWRLHFPVG